MRFNSRTTCLSWLWVREAYQMRGHEVLGAAASRSPCASQEARDDATCRSRYRRQPSDAHRRQRVLPVPVGDSKSALPLPSNARTTDRM